MSHLKEIGSAARAAVGLQGALSLRVSKSEAPSRNLNVSVVLSRSQDDLEAETLSLRVHFGITRIARWEFDGAQALGFRQRIQWAACTGAN